MVHSVRLARRCSTILPLRQSHGHQLQLADRLWGHEEPTVFDHRLQEVGHDSLFRMISWSFNVLQTGIESVVHWEDKDLMCEDPMYAAAKYTAILTHIRATGSSTRVRFPCRSGATLRACAGSVAPLATEGHELSYGTLATEMHLGGPLV